MASGYLYALANDSMPGVFKVGCTTRNPFDRAKELRTTGVPTPFFVIAAIHVPDVKAAEAAAHVRLGQLGVRVQGDREFFSTTAREIGQVFAELIADPSADSARVAPPSHAELYDQAVLYHHGQDLTPPDLKKALSLYEQAALAGSLRSARALSSLYGGGKGVRKSEEKFHYYWKRARELADTHDGKWESFLLALPNHEAESSYQELWKRRVSRGDLENLNFLLEHVDQSPYANLTDPMLPLAALTRYVCHRGWSMSEEIKRLSLGWSEKNIKPQIFAHQVESSVRAYLLSYDDNSSSDFLDVLKYMLDICKELEGDLESSIPYFELQKISEKGYIVSYAFEALRANPILTLKEWITSREVSLYLS
ncbi:GIY-YIG nuclease family protein [Deinococcus soli (ex Cha et al. 2016)]|uniref:GIY-YIG nuclease family protein n=1 Tax=Deinococcus soli (ex Cha et al. 2016) TaxID=1309411 RepID=UPI001667A2BF|nr:GIY-YIG nuclease family protein [Deinococcus soli (ex Cha et al. 2016)]GGB84842.1 hypothetical protein GCM10008019_46020 [Deinococcus soli (ex Cha et al. 2016)]